MSPTEASAPAASAELPNGSGAAAILAASIGSFTLAILAIASDHLAILQRLMVFYKPTGPLSGVTTSTMIVWVVIWALLDLMWRRRTVNLGRANAAALALLILSLLLTCPPLADLF